MRRAGLPFLAITLLTIGPVAAQSATSGTISPSHLAAARALLGAMNFEETAVTAGMQAFDLQVAAAPQLAQFRDLMEEWTREVFGSEEALDAFARTYAETVAQADIEALTAFYRTPAGARVAASLPALSAKGATLGQRLATSHQAELQQRMMARAAELEASGGSE